MATLMAEDLLLLLLDDERGTPASTWVDLGTPLAAAALAEPAALGAVEMEEGSWGVQRLRATGVVVPDPTPSRVLSVVAEKPRTAGGLVGRVKQGLGDELAERLERAGLLRRHEGRVLGLFPRTTWPAADAAREREVRQRLLDVLIRGAEPDERAVVLVGVLRALDVLPRVLGLHGAEAREAKQRAKALSKGEWASKTVSDAVQATMVAVMTPVIVTTAVGSSG